MVRNGSQAPYREETGQGVMEIDLGGLIETGPRSRSGRRQGGGVPEGREAYPEDVVGSKIDDRGGEQSKREGPHRTEMASCCVGASSPTWAATCRIARGPTSSFGDPLKLWMGQSRCSCLGEEGLRG